MIYATVIARATVAALTAPRRIYATVTAPMAKVSKAGQLYDETTGALLYDELTGAPLVW